MNKKYRLLPHQVEALQTQYEKNYRKLQSLNVIKKDEFSEYKTSNGTNEMNIGLDSSFLGSLEITTRLFKEAQEKLGNYELIEQSSSDNIELGSCFEFLANGEEESEIFVLVETVNLGEDYSFISMNSPFGKAVLGASAGDAISYCVDGRKFEGTIAKIIKPRQKTL